MPATTYSPTRFSHTLSRAAPSAEAGLNFRVRDGNLVLRQEADSGCLSVARASEWQDFCGYPRIAWVIPCHQEGLLRHMYVARLWPTINNGNAKRYALWMRLSTRI